MPVQADVYLAKFEDGVLTVDMNPPVNVGGWSARFLVQKRFGGLSGLIRKDVASGYGGGQSGITVVNSGQGSFNIALNGRDTSGMDLGVYSYAFERLDSGNRTVLSEGHLVLLPPACPP